MRRRPEIEERIAARVDLTEFELVECRCARLRANTKEKTALNAAAKGKCNGALPARSIFASTTPSIAPFAKAKAGTGVSNARSVTAIGRSRATRRSRSTRANMTRSIVLCAGGPAAMRARIALFQGDGQIPRGVADEVDVEQYRNVKCPLCKGRGQFDGEDCPACRAQGEMPRGQADELDLSDYKKVNCPLCKGRHDGCPFCGGEGEVFKGDADNFDPRDYR